MISIQWKEHTYNRTEKKVLLPSAPRRMARLRTFSRARRHPGGRSSKRWGGGTTQKEGPAWKSVISQRIDASIHRFGHGWSKRAGKRNEQPTNILTEEWWWWWTRPGQFGNDRCGFIDRVTSEWRYGLHPCEAPCVFVCVNVWVIYYFNYHRTAIAHRSGVMVASSFGSRIIRTHKYSTGGDSFPRPGVVLFGSIG